MTRVFVDTEAWFSLADKASPTHRQTADAVARHSTDLVTTTFVLAELVALVVSRQGHGAAAHVGKSIRRDDGVALIHPDERQVAVAWRRFLARPDTTYSLTDCISFVVIEELGVSAVISSDRHFRQEGFTVMPAG